MTSTNAISTCTLNVYLIFILKCLGIVNMEVNFTANERGVAVAIKLTK